ncbi:MAG: indole-3-glycerol phosphate synthase TrpC [Vicinamibacteria bacterium]
MNVLDELVAAARERVKDLPNREPRELPRGVTLGDALRGKDRLKVIAEFKQASPSAGSIAQRDPAAQVRLYAEAGAAAVSVLTEPSRFGGSFDDLQQAVEAVGVPVLMKDFVVDAAQIRMAACLGARGVLLIARCLSDAQLRELASTCRGYGLGALVECHDAEEVSRALALPEVVIGVNNRDLDTFEIRRDLAPRLLRDLPSDRVAVAESGYLKPRDTVELRGVADAVLIGSALMKDRDPGAFIRGVIGTT